MIQPMILHVSHFCVSCGEVGRAKQYRFSTEEPKAESIFQQLSMTKTLLLSLGVTCCLFWLVCLVCLICCISCICCIFFCCCRTLPKRNMLTPGLKWWIALPNWSDGPIRPGELWPTSLGEGLPSTAGSTSKKSQITSKRILARPHFGLWRHCGRVTNPKQGAFLGCVFEKCPVFLWIDGIMWPLGSAQTWDGEIARHWPIQTQDFSTSNACQVTLGFGTMDRRWTWRSSTKALPGLQNNSQCRFAPPALGGVMRMPCMKQGSLDGDSQIENFTTHMISWCLLKRSLNNGLQSISNVLRKVWLTLSRACEWSKMALGKLVWQ